MAASAWGIYNEFKRYLGTADFDMGADIFRINLHQTASNAATLTLSIISEVTNEVASGNGYSTSGKTLSATTWATGDSAAQVRFDATAVIWTATGGTIPNVRFAVVYKSGASASKHKLVCFSALSTAQFTVSQGNTLTITPAVNDGLFELA